MKNIISISKFIFLVYLVSSNVNAFDPSTVEDSKNCFPENYEPFIKKMVEVSRASTAKRTFLKKLKRKVPKKKFERFVNNYDCSIIVYRSDGYKVGGIIIKPILKEQHRVPAVVYNRGGNGRYGALNYFDIFDYLMPIAELGVVVLASQYRGGMIIDGGPEESADNFGGSDINDISNIVSIARELPYIIPSEIHMVGESRGGMSALILMRERKMVKTLTLIGTPTNLFTLLKRRPEMEQVYKARIPGYSTKSNDELRRRSAIFWVKELPKDLPILIIHGKRDSKVSVEQAKELANSLAALNRPHKVVLYDDFHSLHFSRGRVYDEINSWLFGNNTNVGR